MEIRPARAADADALTALAHRAKSHWGYPAEWIAGWQSALTLAPGYLEAHAVHVAASPEGLQGFYAVEPGTDQRGLWSLAHLWVDPIWHGQGIGRRLFQHAAAIVRQSGGDGLLIESDPHAVAFYERLGARRIGTTAAPVPGDPARTLPVQTYTWAEA